MATPDVARTQALAGLSLMSFSSLCFQAVWQYAYADKPGPLNVPDALSSTGHYPALENAHFETLVLKINALSNTIAQVNTTLHAKIDSEIRALMAKGSSWNQPQPPPTITPMETAVIFSIVFATAWSIGVAILHHNASLLSKGFQAFVPKVILLALLAANFGLVVSMFFGSSMRWYVHVLVIVWPVQVALGVKVLTEKVDIDKGEKGGKK